MSNFEQRLDAAESVFFARQLESIDARQYQVLFSETKSRLLLPTQGGVSEDALVYTWRMFEHFGQAKVIANAADDLPSVDVSGQEQSVTIKEIGASYGWDLREIKASMRGGFDLDAEKAMSCRRAIDRKIDDLLATGSTLLGMQGFLTLTGAPTFTLGTKSGGGLTWANGTPDEIAADLTGIVTARKLALKGAGGAEFDRFTIVIPIDKYALIAQTRMGDGSDKTILKFVLETSPWIESIESWSKCTLAGAGGATDRMVAYVKDPAVVSAIVPQEFRALPPQQRNLRYVINCTASCGGVVARYLVALAYADGL